MIHIPPNFTCQIIPGKSTEKDRQASEDSEQRPSATGRQWLTRWRGCSMVSRMKNMEKHTHNFVDTYEGMVGFGLDRETDENTIIYYLQKFSDDALMAQLIKQMTDSELEEIFNLLNRLLKNHLTEADYHRLFLKDKKHS